jgi:molecular chaperone HtpG
VADDDDIDIHLERMLRQHKQLKAMSKRILEVNPAHPLVKALAETVRAKGENQAVQARVNEVAKLLLDQARIVEGERLDDPADFARRMAAALAAGFAPG